VISLAKTTGCNKCAFSVCHYKQSQDDETKTLRHFLFIKWIVCNLIRIKEDVWNSESHEPLFIWMNIENLATMTLMELKDSINKKNKTCCVCLH